jgi:hypothetical protein
MSRRTAGALALALCAATGVALSAGGAFQQTPGVLQELSVREPEARDAFFSGIWDGYPGVPGGREVFKAASPEKRAAIVTGLGVLVRAYTQTPLFRERYAKYWEANRPRPSDPPKSRAEQEKEQQQSIREMEENLKTLPPDVRKQMEEVVRNLKSQQEALKKNTQMQAMLADAARMEQEERIRRDGQRLEEYEAEHPKDPDAMIARRLREFLEISGTVDFSATLVKRGSLMRFAKPENEERPDEWKLCYRAGREATAAARAFAQEWLKALGAGD